MYVCQSLLHPLLHLMHALVLQHLEISTVVSMAVPMELKAREGVSVVSECAINRCVGGDMGVFACSHLESEL